MLQTLPALLSPDQVRRCRQALASAQWIAGGQTAGHVARKVKDNEQLPQDSETGRQLGELLLSVLAADPRFMAAALPLKVVPPRFNRYRGGGTYGDHIDNAVFSIPGSGHRIRADLSATVFLSDPGEYDGGELVIQDTYGERRVKLPAGDMVLYSSGSLHRVEPVARGERLASFFWVQSLVREDAQRGILFDLDRAIQHVGSVLPDDPAVAQLSGVYHNLLRSWAQT